VTTGGAAQNPPFFEDGFETGDTNGWDTVVGGS